MSGTTPSNLAAANGLLRDLQESSGQPRVGLTDANARQLAGLIAARFHRDAFHSPPEVLVGLRHWEAHRHPNDPVHPEQSMDLYRDPEDVRNLFADSVALMAAASTPEVQACVAAVIDDLRATPSLTDMGEAPPPPAAQPIPPAGADWLPAADDEPLGEEPIPYDEPIPDGIEDIDAPEEEGTLADEGLTAADRARIYRETIAQARAGTGAADAEAVDDADAGPNADDARSNEAEPPTHRGP